MGQLRPQDRQLLFHVRVLDIQIGAPPPQGLGQGSCPVGGQHHEGDGIGLDRPHLRDRHLHLRQQLQKERLKFLVGLVDLVDQQHHGLLRTDGFQQRPFQQIFVAEQRAGQRFPVLGVHVHLNGQELLLVVPLIERLAFIQPLVALQPHQLPVKGSGHDLGHLGLAHTGGALDQQGPAQLQSHVQHRRQRIVINIVLFVHLSF